MRKHCDWNRLAGSTRMVSSERSVFKPTVLSLPAQHRGGIGTPDKLVRISPLTHGTLINLGGADVLTAGSKVLGISSDELGSMFGSVMRIGSRDTTPSGPITISQPIEPANFSRLHLRSGQSVSGPGSLVINNIAVSAETGIDLQAANQSSTVALHNRVSGSVAFRELNGMTIGTVDGVVGATAAGSMNPLSISLDAGGLAVSEPIQAFGADGSVNLSAEVIVVRALVSGAEQGTTVLGAGLPSTTLSRSGVKVEQGGTITASGEGAVFVQGTGSSGASGSNIGVWVVGNGSAEGSSITSSGGPVTVVGNGGFSTGPQDHGVRVSFGGQIQAAAPGSVTIVGNGGPNSIGAFGVLVDNHHSRIAADGTVAVEGSGVAGGVVLRDRGALVSVSASPLTVTTDSLLIDGPDANSLGSIDANGAIVRIAAQTAETLLDLGGPDVLSGSPMTLGLSSAELDRITASTLVLGDAATGPVTVSQPIAPINVTNLEVVGGTSINVNAPITLGAIGLLALDAHQNLRIAANITAGSGGLQLTGRGNQALNSIGVFTTSGAVIKAVSNGDISILGSGGAGTGAGNYGVGIGNSQVVTEGTGTINIDGYGGTGASNSNYGLWIFSNGIVETDSGDVSLFG